MVSRMDNSSSYHRERAQQERDFAKHAADQATRGLHLKLGDLHEKAALQDADAERGLFGLGTMRPLGPSSA